MSQHRAARLDRRTLALYCGEQLYGYLIVSPRLRYVAQGRLPLAEADPHLEPTYEELRVQRGLDRLPGSLPLPDCLRHLRGLVEDAWQAADDMSEFADRSEAFEAEARYRAATGGSVAYVH